jgi:hypothetical protein
MEKNPYELQGRKPAGPPKKVKGREWSPEEQKEKLKDYIEMPRSDWEKVKYGTHVRYYTKEGEFRTGGFVLNNPYSYKPRNSPKEVVAIRLQNNYNQKAPGYAAWVAPYESISRLFVKMESGAIALRDLFEEALRNSVEGLNGNIRKIATAVGGLEGRLSALEGRVSSLESGRSRNKK